MGLWIYSHVSSNASQRFSQSGRGSTVKQPGRLHRKMLNGHFSFDEIVSHFNYLHLQMIHEGVLAQGIDVVKGINFKPDAHRLKVGTKAKERICMVVLVLMWLRAGLS
jgi:hypothetical protein